MNMKHGPSSSVNMISILSSPLLFATLSSAAIFFDPSAEKYSCVNDDGSTLAPGVPLYLTDVDTRASDQTILLKPIKPDTVIVGGDEDGTTSMCTLHRWTMPLEDKLDKKGYYFPLGRSSPHLPAEVIGNTTGSIGDWSRPPGRASHSTEYKFLCGEASNSGSNFAAGEYLCEVTLPATSQRNATDPKVMDQIDVPYFLTYYQRTMTVRNELSRFLQQNTFGPTKSELDTLEAKFTELRSAGSNVTYAAAMAKVQRDWIVDQMDPTTFTSGEFSSLRAYWRRRLNPRAEETYRIGESGPHPCEKHSRWRKFAFTNYDVQNAKSLRWGNMEVGGKYQMQQGHRITVETVTYYATEEVPAPSPSSNVTTETLAPSPISNVTTETPAPSPGSNVTTESRTLQGQGNGNTPALSLNNLLVLGDMESADQTALFDQWPGQCARTVVLASATPDYVYSGTKSLRFAGGKKCFFYRPLAPACGSNRIVDPIKAGDTLLITMKVLTDTPGQIFQMYTALSHADKGQSPWATPEDDSYMVSRTLVSNANEWVTVEALHKVGDDWKYRGKYLHPVGCNDFHLRFRLVDSVASFYLDDVTVTKTASLGIADASITNATDFSVPTSGFIINPNFVYSHQYWQNAPAAGYLRKDAELNRDVMVLRHNSTLSQNVLKQVVPGKTYNRYRFLIKLSNVDSINLGITVRMKFSNKDIQHGPCSRPVCNFQVRLLNTTVTRGDGGWQEMVTDEFEMFGNFTEWDGSVDFIMFQAFTENMDPAGEYSIAGFEEVGADYTDAPSMSVAPSASPTNLEKEHVAYIVRYAGEIRTVIKYPFQIDNDGTILPMDGTEEYELCEVDEVEGRKAEFPDRMNFFIDRECKAIRHGNPTVNLDPNFVNMTDLHLLDLSEMNDTSVSPINVNQTFGGDWLLKSAVQDDACAAFPTPYDNDYRGADPRNPQDIPTRFTPDKPVFAKLPDDTYALFDSRLILHGNTVENPIIDGGGNAVLRSTLRTNRDGFKTMQFPWDEEYYVYNDHNIALCSNEQPNFINQDNCVLSYEENVCVKEYIETGNSLVDVELVITFDDETLAKLHNVTLWSTARSVLNVTRYIYALDNLRWDDSILDGNVTLPCVRENPVSRWIPRPDLNGSDCTNSLTDRSKTALVEALESSNDENPHIRDIYLWNDAVEDGCDEEDYDKYGMLIMTELEGCWENVHPDFMSIYDFTGYVANHPAPNVTYITNWTAIGVMQYPDNHPASFFEKLKSTADMIIPIERYTYASTSRVNQGARYGDSIVLDQFAEQLRLNTNPTLLKAIATDIAKLTLSNKVATNRGGGTLVCGSPNEVAPDPSLDDYFDVINRDLDCIGCMNSYGDYSKQKATVWAMNALDGEDQFCQRMAWSLYELLNVGAASNPDNTESNLYTYDIMIRHCFGNYFDILKEMTYSPKMGEQFSFVDSTSTRISWDTSGRLVFPDENYGREIMQLYTIGLHELNPDGTELRDPFGRVTQTYTNLDIMSNARVMTGFSFTARRGNIEELFRSPKSRQDPLRIEVDKHDFFPKSSVDGNWIGDRYPLCVDLPKYHFLKLGAKFVFRGGASIPTVQYNPPHWHHDESIKRFVLSPGSALYSALCNPGNDGTCNFANTIVLDSNLSCFGKECRVDDLQVVQVAPGAFYEYVRQPCVGLSFYNNPKKIITGFAPWVKEVGRRHTHAMCADPRTAVAARSCCNSETNHLLHPDKAEYNYDFEYHGERVTLQTSVNQCAAANGTVCDPIALKADNPLVNIRPVYNYPYPTRNTFFWTDADCSKSVKVRGDGMIAIIHQPSVNPWFSDNTVPYVDLINSFEFFSVTWANDPMTLEPIYPMLNNSCGNGACSIAHDDNCLCSVTVLEVPAFSSLPSREEVLRLHVGAFHPDTFSDSAINYSLLQASDDVEVFVSSDSGIIGDTSTIFKVVNEHGDTVFFKNLNSTIKLGNNYELRNPPSFMNLARVELRDAEYEVDAFLTHLIRYPSAPPFISKKLIQYHGISNPSPGFVHRVSQAFISGSFNNGAVSFGSNQFGDLKAVAAAIALDPESLSPVIDEDPVSGNVREPLLKVIQFMRSLSFQRSPTIKFRHGLFEDMSFKIGQFVFDPPDQFSFFPSDYSPPGVFANVGLVSPESKLLSMSSVVGLSNGLTSFVDYGLVRADGGFAPYFDRPPSAPGDYSTSLGQLTLPHQINNITSLSDKIDELSTMMTAGRLSAENKQVIQDAHAYFHQYYGIDFADRIILKLMVATPEFHTSNTLRKTGSPRSISPIPPKSSSPYKAIVYINLSGGVDSFNILTPGATFCPLYNEYFEARGGAAGIGLMKDEVLPIDGASAMIFECDTLGVHKNLTAFKDIYDEGKGIFFANMGHLHKPVTIENWFTETRTDLFSHHTMRREAQVVDAFREGDGPGVLGRMLDILERHGHAVGATAINGRVQMIDGSPSTGRLADVMSTEGSPRIVDRNFLKGESQQLRDFLKSLHAETDDNSGIFGDAWSQSFVDVWNKTDALALSLRDTKLATSFPIPAAKNVGGISSQLELIAKLITIRNERGNGINRDVFFCEMGGYDTHSEVKVVMAEKLPSLNHAVGAFWAEMKAQGLENNIVVVQGSEFGRTITPNSNTGSDHGWGGNYFMFGGDVKGGVIKGDYPKSFLPSDLTNIGRGRLLPTTSWDALFYALAQWMGISEQSEIDYVLPNSQNFGCNLYTDSDLFNSGQQVLNGCGGVTHSAPIIFQVPEIRRLTGEEQKEVCKLATLSASTQLGFDRTKARCYVSKQAVAESEIAPGMYDVRGTAVMNFDGTLAPNAVSVQAVELIGKTATATASDFLITDAIPQSEAPSSMPSNPPSISSQPSAGPSVSTMPSNRPSHYPSFSPSVSTEPSFQPSLSTMPSNEPSSQPSTSQSPSEVPSSTQPPSVSSEPTLGPTARKVFNGMFLNRDIGTVTYAGNFSEAASGLYTIRASGSAIGGSSDNFHYMYIETSGDVTFTALIEGLDASQAWAKGGIMVRSSLTSQSSHYSLFKTNLNGVSQQYRSCSGCTSYQYGRYEHSSVWLRVIKEGNVMKAFYKPSYLSKTDPWSQFGYELSMTSILSNGYFIGIAVTSNSVNGVASCHASNIQLERTCSNPTITTKQCDQASNCESGPLSGSCYNKGEIPSWEILEPIANIFDTGSYVTSFGCSNSDTVHGAFDATTNGLRCDNLNLPSQPPSLIIRPSHRRLTIAERLRVYANKDCPNCDPVSYIFEGRVNPTSSWIEIRRGDLPWKNATSFPRNTVLGRSILSTHKRGDDSLIYTEATFYDYDYSQCGPPPFQKEYRGTMNSTVSGRTCQRWSVQTPHTHSRTETNYPGTGLGNHNYCRNPDGQSGGAWCYTTDAKVRWEHCDVPDCKDDPSTLNDYFEYKITWTATRGSDTRPITSRRLPPKTTTTTTSTALAQLSLQLAEIEVPGLIGDEPPMPTLQYDGDYVPSIISGIGTFTITLIDGFSDGFSDEMAFDGSTTKFSMYRPSFSTDSGPSSPSPSISTTLSSQEPPNGSRVLARPITTPPPTRMPTSMPTPLPTTAPPTRPPTTQSQVGFSFTLSHGRKSVVTGLRLYMANGDSGADPIKYQISGRLMGDSNFKNRRDNLCWSINDDFWLVPNSVCSSSDIRQQLYMNTLGEIRVHAYPGFCLNSLYGYFYSRNRFTTCYSDYDYGDPYWNSVIRGTQKFTFDPITKQLKNVNDYVGSTCAHYDLNRGRIAQKKCTGSRDQQFVVAGTSASDWALISEGNFPWISDDKRNPVGVQMASTYDEGDSSKYFVEVRFYENTTPYDEYRILFPETRDPESPMLEFAELELPGLLLHN